MRKLLYALSLSVALAVPAYGFITMTLPEPGTMDDPASQEQRKPLNVGVKYHLTGDQYKRFVDAVVRRLTANGDLSADEVRDRLPDADELVVFDLGDGTYLVLFYKEGSLVNGSRTLAEAVDADMAEAGIS